MAQVNVLELETRVFLDEDLHTTIEEFQKRVQAQWVEIIMDSLLPVSFLIPFSFSSQGNVESFMGSWFLCNQKESARLYNQPQAPDRTMQS